MLHTSWHTTHPQPTYAYTQSLHSFLLLWFLVSSHRTTHVPTTPAFAAPTIFPRFMASPWTEHYRQTSTRIRLVGQFLGRTFCLLLWTPPDTHALSPVLVPASGYRLLYRCRAPLTVFCPGFSSADYSGWTPEQVSLPTPPQTTVKKCLRLQVYLFSHTGLGLCLHSILVALPPAKHPFHSSFPGLDYLPHGMGTNSWVLPPHYP